MGGICDLITLGAPPLLRTAPSFGDAPKVNPDADSLLRAASGLVDSPDRAQASAEIRAPPATPKPPPPVLVAPDQDNAQMTDFPPDYQADCPDRAGNGRIIAIAPDEKQIARFSPKYDFFCRVGY